MTDNAQVQPPVNDYPDEPVPAGSYVTAGYPPTAKRKSKATKVLAALTVVFFLAAGAFGALWYFERNDHKATTSQLSTARGEAEDSKAKQADAETNARELTARAKDAEDDRRELEIERDRENTCAAAGRTLVAAVKVNDPKTVTDAVTQLVLKCPVP
jgi:uncharacterized protein HemX